MPEEFSGSVEIKNASDSTTINLDGNNGDVMVRDSSGRLVFNFDSSTAILTVGDTGNEGDIRVKDSSGRTVFNFDSNSATLYLGANGNEGDIRVRDGSGRTVFNFDSNSSALYLGSNGNAGDLQIRDGSGRTVFNFSSGNAALYLGANGNEGDLQIRDGSGRTVFNFDSNLAALYLGAAGNEGDLQIRDAGGRTVFNFDSNYAVLRLGEAGNEGDLILKDNGGDETIHLDGGSGDIILRNADAAEHFDIADMTTAEPGTVMALGDDGKLKPSTTAYNSRVVGVIAGAGEYRPGIVLDKQNDDDSRLPISMMGKVACKADATYTSIEVGDLLTTSETTGHAMKATDSQKAFGAIIGKAMSPLSDGIGYVNMLVTLQ